MSDLPPPLTPADDGFDDAPDMAAAELALGLLEGEERAGAIRRVLAEPGFARTVERWRMHFSQMFDLWPAVEAPDLLARIERSLDGPAATAPALAPAPATTPVATFVPAKRAGGALWPALAGFSSIAAAGLLVVLLTRPVPLPPGPPSRPSAPVVAALAPTLVAALDADAAGAVSVSALYDAQGGAVRLTEARFAKAGRTAELWIIPADGTPHSLGLLHTRGGTALKLSPENRARIAAGALLAVTIEPIGGSPTGLPTGPIVAKGALSRV